MYNLDRPWAGYSRDMAWHIHGGILVEASTASRKTRNYDVLSDEDIVIKALDGGFLRPGLHSGKI